MNNSIELTQIGRYDSGIFDEDAAEITAFFANYFSFQLSLTG